MNCKNNSCLFILYLALLVWAPLPLGSNRIWALSILELGIFLLAFIWLMRYSFKKATINATFLAARFPVAIFALFTLYVFMQSIPLPMAAVEFIAPEIAQSYSELAVVNGTPVNTAYLSLNPYVTFGKFVETFSYFLLFCLTLLLVNTRKRLRILALIIVASGVFQAVYGVMMTLTGLEYGFFYEKVYGRGLATGTFVNRNHLAGYLEMALALGLGLMLASLHRDAAQNWREFSRRMLDALLGSKLRLRIALVLMVIALVMTHSRMGNTAFFVSMTIMGLVYLLLVKNPPRSAMVLFVSLIIIDILIVGTWFGLDKVIDRLQKTQVTIQHSDQQPSSANLPLITDSVEGIDSTQPDHEPQAHSDSVKKLQVLSTTIESSTETRDEAYRDTLTMIKQHLLSGTGGGTYRYSFMRYQSEDVRGYWDHAHHDYLEFTAEYGLIGISLLGVLMFYSLTSALVALRERHSRIMQGMAFATAMAIIAILIHSAFDFNLQIPAIAALFVVILAVAIIVRFKKMT